MKLYQAFRKDTFLLNLILNFNKSKQVSNTLRKDNISLRITTYYSKYYTVFKVFEIASLGRLKIIR